MKQKSRIKIQLLTAILALSCLIGCSDSGKLSVQEFESIKSGFISPADTNKVWCYWYWLNDDISKEGVTKDLEAMKEAGIGGAFIGNINPDEVDGRVPLFSDQWWEIMVHAVNEGKRLGVDIGTFNCPGWSQSGGPWVKPEMAMRYLTYSETKVTGGAKIAVNLPKPHDLFQDVYVLAILHNESKYKTINQSGEKLFETNPQKSYSLEFAVPGTIKANTILLYPAKAQLKADCELFALQGGEYKLIKSFNYDRSNNSPSVGPDIYGPVAISIPGIESGNFRLICRNLTSNEAKAGFAEVIITEEILLEKYVEKQLGKMHPTPFPTWGTYLWDKQVNSNVPDKGIPESEIIDVSQFMDANGNLQWDAPAGKWAILRFGMTPTGTRNSPAAPQGKGYEIDKANSELIRFHFKNYVGELLKRIPAESRSALKYVIADSYEMGSQNWTDGYAEKFKLRYGYDPKKYFPVLSGRIVGSVEESERFLWDLRRAVADDIAYEYVGGLREISNENNLKIWLENYGHWGFPSEFLMYGGQSDLVSGEFWNEGELGNIECKASSSAAHIYGKPKTSAESFTAAGNSYLRYPALLKRRGDWSFTEGINHVVVHVYIHQPDDKRIPGINAWFSTEFNRHNTWFKQSKVWFDYERRCQHLLQQGKYAADVCYFIGDDAPKMTGARNPELPSGYSYDYINAEVILQRLTVKDGRFVLPDGMSYRIMVLPPLKTIRPEVLEKLSSLVKSGGIILGPKPEKSPGLKGYPACDEQVKLLADSLWGADAATIKTRKVGNGFVLSNLDLKEAFGFIKVPEDFNPEGKYPVLWTHRTMPGMDIYFITNQGNAKVNFKPSFRTAGKQPQLWDAVSGKIRLLNEFTVEGERTYVPLSMEPGQSWFVVFSDQKKGISDEGFSTNFPGKMILKTLGGPWKVDFSNKVIGPDQPVYLESLVDLSKSESEKIRYYSGTITYTTDFELDRVPVSNRVYLDLGDVKVIAHVKINGSDAGGIWMFPWIVEIKNYLKPGKNTVEIEVANLWRNRMILDSRLPEKDRYTWTVVSDSKSNEAPPSSGLIGPVTIKTDESKSEAEFRNRVYACWLGKNIGGTLGMPFEGKTEANNIAFYTRIKEGEPAANDDLDLQILWLKAMEENNCRVDAYTLGEYWLKFVPVDWNEYGVGKVNMRLGIMPPLSGEYNNAKWKTSNGAWIRSEIWACLAPGNPMLAAQFAWNDACVDHGCTEGTFAEIFTATLESAAFVEKDMNKLINFALSMIPGDCRVASAVNTAVEAKKSGRTWQQAREAVIKATEDLGWFQAPRNVAFTMIGWLYGDGDFGKSICIAVNCGDDTDCTGATLGSIFGIIYGSAIIPEKWRAPIGDGIVTVAVSGFEVPATLQALTDKTVAMQKKVAELYQSSLKVTPGKTNLPDSHGLLAVNKNELSQIWRRSPYKIARNTDELSFTCDYGGAPEIQIGQSKVLNISILNKTNKEKQISLNFKNVPSEYSVKGIPEGFFTVGPQSKYDAAISINASQGAANAKFVAEINDSGKILDMQLGVIRLNAHGSSDPEK